MKIGRNYFLSIVILFVNHTLLAQNEANVWIFNKNLGIDFNDMKFNPFNLNFDMADYGGSAVQCDPETGELLFFTNNRTVWDRNYQIMSNGVNLKGAGYEVLSGKSVIIVPFPSSPNKYYIFNTAINNYEGIEPGLYYSVVDLSKNNGNGMILPDKKNKLIVSHSINKVIAVQHTNKKDAWVITHENESNKFIVVPVTSEGVGPPEYTLSGENYSLEDGFFDGGLSASPNGKVIACAFATKTIGKDKKANPLSLFTFDPASGEIDEEVSLGSFTFVDGLGFSPDNSKLYIGVDDTRTLSSLSSRIFQFDLSKKTTENIIASKTYIPLIIDPLPDRPNSLYDTLGSNSFQLAPDGRIYLGTFGLQHFENNDKQEISNIFYLEYPDSSGLGCQPLYRIFNASQPTVVRLGTSFPNFMQHIFNGLKPTPGEDQSECQGSFSVYPNPVLNLLKIKQTGACSLTYELKLYNILGQLLVEKNDLSVPLYALDFSSFSGSMYFLEINYTNGFRSVRKIIRKEEYVD